MIISLDKKFVCINPPKTGTGYRESIFKTVSDYSVNGISEKMLKLLPDIKHDPIKHRHAKIDDAVTFLYESGLDHNDFYFFTFVRNPWHRIESWYNMLINQQVQRNYDSKNIIIEQYINAKEFAKYVRKKQHVIDGYIHGKKRNIDFYGKLETIDTDLQKLAGVLDLKIQPSTGNRCQKNMISYHDNIKQLWNDVLIQLVAEDNKYIIDIFNYKPD